MIEKLKTAVWFSQRPSFWRHAVELTLRKFRPNRDSKTHHRQATQWAESRVVSVAEAMKTIGLHDEPMGSISTELLNSAEQRAEKAGYKMGGPGDLGLLYAAVLASGATRVIETGVAYGWSSLAILAALQGRADARLVSVDMPYPKMNNEEDVGIVVPDDFKSAWELIREPDRNGLMKAISRFEAIDLCHYDSDKSWSGRQFAYPLLWDALAPGGVFISDDIQDNMVFSLFVENMHPGVPFAVTESGGKFVGILRKPQ